MSLNQFGSLEETRKFVPHHDCVPFYVFCPFFLPCCQHGRKESSMGHEKWGFIFTHSFSASYSFKFCICTDKKKSPWSLRAMTCRQRTELLFSRTHSSAWRPPSAPGSHNLLLPWVTEAPLRKDLGIVTCLQNKGSGMGPGNTAGLCRNWQKRNKY